MSSPTSRLPERPSLEQLRKQAKERLQFLRVADPDARLADAQFALAREYGFDSWPKLIHHVTALRRRSSLPRITAPVSRFLGARDLPRSVRFWRDVLGFEAHPVDGEGGGVELLSGEARIRLGERDWAPDFTGGARPPGSAIVFFQTDDVEGMHATVHARGGSPSELEKVNWIKLRMFEIRDPDGHPIWFGQSYGSEGAPRPKGMMRTIMPELPAHDVPAAVVHYREILGFSVNHEQPDIAVMDRDEIRLLLVEPRGAHSGPGAVYVYVRDVDELFAEMLGKGADIQGEPVSQPWGLREFAVLDCEGNRLTFGQTFE